MGTQTRQADEEGGRCGSGPWVAWTGIEPKALRQGSEESVSDPEKTGLARFRADLRGGTVGQTAPDSRRQRNLARLDDRSGPMEEQGANDRGRACLETAAKRVRRTGAVGHVRSRLARRQRAGALPGADDRRC